jgi:hypothetical protein
MATILTEMGHLTDSFLTNAGRKMATHSKSKTCRNAVNHKPISIKVEFDKLIAACPFDRMASALKKTVPTPF